jgi:hypothetical protein
VRAQVEREFEQCPCRLAGGAVRQRLERRNQLLDPTQRSR